MSDLVSWRMPLTHSVSLSIDSKFPPILRPTNDQFSCLWCFFHSFDKLDTRFILRFKYSFTNIIGRFLVVDVCDARSFIYIFRGFIGK